MIHWHIIRNNQGRILIRDDPNPPPCPGLPEGLSACLMPTVHSTAPHSQITIRPNKHFRVKRLMVTSQIVTLCPHDSMSWPKYLLVFHFVLTIESQYCSRTLKIFCRQLRLRWRRSKSCKKVNTLFKGLQHRLEYIGEQLWINIL